MEPSIFTFRARSTHSNLKLTVWLNEKIVLEPLLSTESTEYSITFEDVEDGKYQVNFELSGKTPDMTKIDSVGNILSDEVVEINEITVEDIDVTQLFFEKSVYRHNFNGTRDAIDDQFYGTMGCNGVVSFEFTTPFYLWLLENM